MFRRICLLVTATTLATFGLGTTSVGATPTGTAETTSISVVNNGTATRGTTIGIVCVAQIVAPSPGVPPVSVTTAELNFDAQGVPTTKSGDLSPYWSAVGNAWVSAGVSSPSIGVTTCAHTEIDNGGADSTSWTCDFVVVPSPAPTDIGCLGASGSGRGPVVLNWALDSAGLTSETATMVFTNTYSAPVRPQFTG
jgi:hypothetical protein